MNKEKVYLEGYVVGHSADTLGYKGLQIQLENMDVVEIDKNLVHKDINEPQLLKLKDVIARIKDFDSGTQTVWIDVILKEFGSNYGSAKYKDGYEQGKLEGLIEREKVTIPQFVADYIEESRLKGWDLLASMCFVLNAKNKKTTKWFYLDENKNIFALAWINGYTIDEEKRYRVRIKGVYYNSCLIFDKINKKWFLSSIFEIDHQMGSHTRKELEDGGFGEVFDSPLFEVEEVEE